MTLKILDLFSGLGGFSLGLERTGHFKTIAFCDNNKYCNLVLQKHWKGVKIYNDVKEISKERFETDGVEAPDIITGGFPCQPFSVAGKQKGTSDDRHLWPEMFRIIKAFKPRFVIGENVPGIINIQDGVVFETVCTDLESEGYEVQTFNIPASAVGAPHQRKRIWIIATLENSNNNGLEGRLSETRNQAITGKESSVNGSTNTNLSSRRSNGGADQTKPRINGEVQRLRDGNEEESSKTTGVRGLHERTNISEGTVREDRDYKDDNRTLVQTRQSRVQSSEHRGLGTDQTLFEDNQIRQGDDNTTLNRMERRHENVENSRRTLRQGSSIREKNEDADQHQRSSSPSESNVANAITRNVETGRERQWGICKESQGQGTSSDVTSGGETVADTESIESREQTKRQGWENSTRGSFDSRGNPKKGSEEDVADSERIGQQRSRESIRPIDTETNKNRQTNRFDSSSEEGKGWWHVEPNVGRVAHGVSGRVHRLKALGNSIVPQIVEEIGYAIIKATERK